LSNLLGSVLALLVSLVFLQADIDRYRSSEKLVHIYGSRFGFFIFGPGVLRRFYDPSDVPLASWASIARGDCLVCASGLVRGRLFSRHGSSPGLCVAGAFPSERGFFFFPRPRPGSNTCFWRRCLSCAFCVFARCPDPSKHLVANLCSLAKAFVLNFR